MSAARERLLDALASAGAKVTNGGRASTCPAHDDNAPSLSIGDRDDRDGVVINCHAGCSAEAVTAALGMTPADLFDAPKDRRADARPVQVAVYPYTDEQGTVLFDKVRFEPKTFRQRAADGSWTLRGVRRVLYRLPEVLDAVQAGRTVYVAEGEKDADALAAAGVTATCWTEGAWKPGTTAKWREEYTRTLAGAHVVIVRDRDEPGQHTAATIAAELEPVAASVAVVEPTHGKDASDHLAAGRTVDDLTPVHAPAEPVEAAGEPVDEPGESWAALDLSETLAGVLAGTIERPAPTIGRRADGLGLFYRGRVNGVAGASNAGKSWTGFYTCAQEMAAGEHVVYVDLEDDDHGAVTRLLDLGTDPEAIRARFHYVRPAEAFGLLASARFTQLLDQVAPSVVVIDSTGESLALEGAKPNDDDDVARWFRKMPTAIARRCGAAVVVLDHVTKAEDGGLWPIGSQRKRAAITGAQYMQVNVRPFDRTTPGFSKLVCAKDRHGVYRQGQTVALLHVAPGEDGVSLELRAPAETGGSGVGTWRPTAIMEKISKALEAAGEPLGVRALDRAVSGKKEHKQLAKELLIETGHVATEPGRNRAVLHTVVNPYRQADDPLSDMYRGQGDTRTASEPVSGGGGVPVPREGDGGHTPNVSPGDTGGTPGDTGICGMADCTETPRPGKVMCALHFTREPVNQ